MCRYVIVRPDGGVAKIGTAPPPRGGLYAVDLRDRLQPGTYTVMVTVDLNGNAMNPDVKLLRYRRR